MMIYSAEMVRYDGPSFLIERNGTECSEEDLYALGNDAEIVSEVKGWYPYTHLIEMDGQHYLAEVA